MSVKELTVEEVKKYVKKWNENENNAHYVAQAKSVRKLFKEIYTENTELDEVLVKVAAVNEFYSTNIFSPYAVAVHILSIKNLDERLKKRDKSLVKEIAENKIKGKRKNFYSFATKYCANHNENFPIYDSKAEKSLKHFRNKKKGFNFATKELKDYEKFCKIIENFKASYNLTECSYSDLDKFLWLRGKEL